MSGDRDFRDLVIADFAESEANLVALVWSLDADVDHYRMVAAAALDALHTLHVRYERAVADNRRLRDDVRGLREEQLLRAGADDSEAA